MWSADNRGLGASVAFATARGFLGNEYSNNQAEYFALFECLSRALRLQDPNVIFEVDSLLLAEQIQHPPIDPPINLDIAPTFADDGVIAGDESEVLRAIQHMKKVMPMVGLRFSMMQVVAAAAGPQHPGRFRAFQDEGCTPALDGNFEVMKSPIGDDTFCRAFCSRVAEKQAKVLEFLSELGDPQITHFLARWCINGSRLNYLARTTPPECTQTAACDFHAAVVDMIEATCNVVLSDMQRTRVGFSTKEGGLGLRTIADKTDAAYIASRHATHFLCTQIRHCHRGNQNPRDDHLQRAMDALDVVGPGLDVTRIVPDDITRSLLNERINQQNMANWRNEASPSERVHLQAYSAKGGGHEVSLVPSKTLDTYLTPSEFVNTVSRRLGVDVMDSGMPCCFCGHHLEAQGSHCLSCMAGRDATTLHNGVRDVYFDFCERAGLRPISEAPNILLDVFTLDGRCRPADILCIPALALARVLPNGAIAVRTEPVCMDIAVINALGLDHWRHTAIRAGSAADVYSAAKATRNDISNKCWAAGYRFWPIVHEIQGGMAKDADAAMRAICDAVGKKENTDATTVRVEFLGRLAAVTTRAATRAVQKRMTKNARGPRPTCQP